MVAGLPGTGIGGLFYLLLTVCMPLREFFKTLQGRTSLKRWCFITLQIFFVAGILAAIWAEIWLLNWTLLWLQQSRHIDLLGTNGQLLFRQTGTFAIASAMASFISLTFVLAAVYVLRFFVSRPARIKVQPLPAQRTPAQPQYQAA